MLKDVLLDAIQGILQFQEDASPRDPLNHDLNMLTSELDRIISVLNTRKVKP